MKKTTTKLALILAATALLASCGPQRADTSASEPAPGTSQAAPGTSQAAPGTSQAAPGTSQAAPGTSEPAPGTSQAAPGTSQAAPGTSEPAAPGTSEPAPSSSAAEASDSIFAPIAESPIVPITNDALLGYLKKFHQKAIEVMGSSPFKSEPDAAFVERFLKDDPTNGLLGLLLSNSHLTAEEIDALLDDAFLLLPTIASMSRRQQGASWTQLIGDPELKAAVIKTLKDINLDHLFATYKDLQKLNPSISLAALIPLMMGRSGAGRFDQRWEALLSYNVPAVVDYIQAKEEYNAKINALGQAGLAIPYQEMFSDELIFALLRLTKQAALVGLENVDLAATMNNVMLVSTWFSEMGKETQPSDQDVANAISELAAILDLEFVSDEDLDQFVRILVDCSIKGAKISFESPYSQSNYVVEMKEALFASLDSLGKILTGRGIATCFRFLRNIAKHVDAAALGQIKQADIAGLVATVENVYFALSGEEKSDIDAFAAYAGINIPTLLSELATQTPETIGAYCQQLMSKTGEVMRNRFGGDEYGYYTMSRTSSVVQNGKVALTADDYQVVSKKHGNSVSVAVVGDCDTSETGHIFVPILVTFEDGAKWHVMRSMEVLPAAMTNVGYFESLSSYNADIFHQEYKSYPPVLSYNAEALEKAITEGRGNDTVSFYVACDYAIKDSNGMIGSTYESVDLTLNEFRDALKLTDPYPYIAVAADSGFTAFIALEHYEPEPEPTESSQGQEPTESSQGGEPEPEPAPLRYISGAFNNWAHLDSNYAMEYDSSIDTYVYYGLDLKGGTSLKVMGNNEAGEEVWYPADNVNVPENGNYNVYFDPADESVELEYVDEYQGELGETSYYLVGSFNDWTSGDERYLMTFNKDLNYYTFEISFEGGEKMKIVDSDGKWYPDGMGNDFVIDEAGDFTILFDPSGEMEGGYLGYFLFATAAN